jgi:solute carrier family 25 thiamine pyrophosphate transporter 19
LAQLIRVFPYSGVVKFIQQFSVYGKSERILKSLNKNNSSTVVKFLSGSLAGSVALTMTYPFDVIRTRLAYQTTRKLYDGLFHGFYLIWAEEGLSSMFRGITPALMGASLYGGVTFTIFFNLKSSFPSASNVGIFVFGSVAGIAGQVISYPFDVVRKRMMAHGFLEQVSGYKSTCNAQQINSMFCYFSMIWQVEGLRGMLKGLSLNFVKAPIMLGTVHLANHVIHEKLGEEY